MKREIYKWNFLQGLGCLIFIVMLSGCKEQPREYIFTTLDMPPNSFGTRALGVNDSGDVVGSSGKKGFLFRKGKTLPVPVTRVSFYQVFDINNNGAMVGSFVDSATKLSQAFLYDGTLKVIEPPAVTWAEPSSKAYSYAYGINDDGHVVGYYVANRRGHGFLFNGKRFEELKILHIYDIRATSINNKGLIVGFYFQHKDKRFHGFIYDNGTFTTLDYPGADAFHTRLQGVNDRGDIVGFCSCGPNKAARGFLYRNGAFTDISVPNSSETFPNGINNHGMIVGFYNGSGGGHGFFAVPER